MTSALIQLELYLHGFWRAERRYPKSMRCDRQLSLSLCLLIAAIDWVITLHRKSQYLHQFGQLLAATR